MLSLCAKGRGLLGQASFRVAPVTAWKAAGACRDRARNGAAQPRHSANHPRYARSILPIEPAKSRDRCHGWRAAGGGLQPSGSRSNPPASLACFARRCQRQVCDHGTAASIAGRLIDMLPCLCCDAGVREMACAAAAEGRIKVENPVVDLDGDEMTRCGAGTVQSRIAAGLLAGRLSFVPARSGSRSAHEHTNWTWLAGGVFTYGGFLS